MARGRRKNATPNRGGMAFGRNLMVLAAVILAVGAYGAVRGALTLKWPRANATITSAELLRQTTTSRGLDSRSIEEGWNSFHVLYQYRVGDRDYVAGGVEPYDFGMQNSAGAAKMRERHPIGSEAKVAYDPGNPAVAYLEPGPSSFALALSGIGAFMLLAGWWVRTKAAQGIGAMNEEGAAERIAKSQREGDTL
ncbi:MAG: DUF3592 domain-containing protein [Rhodospirillales bacterium]|nr:DUF3592 domain-containing protein [Rhodospirillales bacterium]